MSMKKIRVKVPATTANLGSGFDSFGVALNLYNEIEVVEIKEIQGRLWTLNSEPAPEASSAFQKGKVRVEIIGEGKDTLPKDERNIVWKAMKKVFSICKKPLYNYHLRLNNRIPLESGLGSSAAATLAGLLAANKICYNKISETDILKLAVELEGHPDNIVAAFAGGFCICYKENDRIEYLKLEMPSDLKSVVCTPEFGLSTKFARKILPKKVPMASAVFNLSRSAVFTASILKKKYELLKVAMEDRLHQSYRDRYIPGIKKVFDSAYKSGAYGVAISGAGPSIVSFSSRVKAKNVALAMEKGFKSAGVKSRSFILDFENKGAV